MNDTTWKDIAGTTINCPSLTSPIDIGAVQSGASTTPDTTPPGNVQASSARI